MALPLIGITLALYLAARVWARWARGRYSIAELFELPCWYWPLTRYTLRKWKRELHKDLWKACQYPEPPKTTWYITISGWEWKREGWRLRLQHRSKALMVRVRVAWGFPQGDEEIPPGEVDPRKQVVNQARGTLDLGPVDYRWNFRLANRHVTLTPREVVPKVAPGMAPDIAVVVAKNLAADTVVPAIGKGDRPIAHSTTDDASHVLLSGTTMGGGKSETLKTFGLQSYAPSILSGRNIPGADLLIIDTTRKFSHTGWAVNHRTRKPWPGIVIATEIDDAAHYLIYAAQAMEERGRVTEQAKLSGKNVEWSRLLIMLDDSNGLHQQLKSHGHDAALEAISMLLWHARGVNMYMIAAFQRGSARASGGGDNREAYGCRIWADGSEKTGDMLADAVDKKGRPKPKPHKIQPGHAVFIYGSLAFETQRIIYTDDEARRVCRMEARRRQRLTLQSGEQEGQQRSNGQGRRPRRSEAIAAPINGRHHAEHHEPADQHRHTTDGVTRQQQQAEQGERGHGSHGLDERLVPDSPGGVGPTQYRPGVRQLVQGDQPVVAQDDPLGPDPAPTVPGSDDDEPREVVVEAVGHGEHDSRPDDGCQPRWLAELAASEGGDKPLTYPRGRGHGPDPQPQANATFRPQSTPQAPRSGFPQSTVANLSIQAIPAISRIDEDDGEVNYITLREIAGRDWCPYAYHTVRSWARENDDADFPDPVEGFSNPRRWSERAVREWIADYQLQGGQKAYGVYFAWKPGDATAKVGFTGNLRARLKKWNYSQEWVRRWIPCGSEREARDMETKMHRKYHDCHEELEWFRVYDRDGNLTRLGRDLELEEARV